MKNFTLLLTLLMGLSMTAQDVIVDIEEFATGLNGPISLTNAGDARLFVVQQDGQIMIVQDDGTVNGTPFLDIAGQVSGGSEQGLLGLAFHPDYDSNGYFYVNYTDNSGDTVVSRFEVSGDPDVADSGSELILMEIAQPFGNHNGGNIEFGPDGYLYISTGDGGSGGDPGNRSQNTEILLGKMLRIDVDNPGGGNNYGIPADNPFVGNPPNAEEIWAYGLRNAWKFSFDSQTGDLWIADVGQNQWEEINYSPSPDPGGINYGWRCYEGNAPFNTGGCDPPETMLFPIADYSSGGGSPHCSVTGGYVYRGTDYPAIDGYYFFADYCSGLIGTINNPGDPDYQEYGTFGGNWSAFGEDVNNELYIVSISGTIYRITGQAIAGLDDAAELAYDMSPNPAKDLLNIQAQGSEPISSIKVYDLKGALLMSVAPDSSFTQLNIGSLQAGVYMVQVSNDLGQTGIKKLIVR